MSTIGKLFGRSPFGQIQAHMKQVACCVELMANAVKSMADGKTDDLEEVAYEVSKLEHHADQLKSDIRNHLFRRFFMPIQPSEILEIISLQDSLADTAEDVCKVMTLKELPFPEGYKEDFIEFIDLSMKAFRGVAAIIDQLDELIESGFGGAEGERIRSMAHEVAVAEHEVDVVQLRLLKTLYENDTKMTI